MRRVFVRWRRPHLRRPFDTFGPYEDDEDIDLEQILLGSDEKEGRRPGKTRRHQN